MSIVNGLEDVIAAETRLSHVDGQKGELIIAGWPLAELVQHFDYSAVATLLWQPWLPQLSKENLQAELGRHRQLAFKQLKPYQAKLQSLQPLEALRLGLDLGADQPELNSPAGLVSSLMISLVLHLGTQAEPDPTAEAVSDLLRLRDGHSPEPEAVWALTRYLVSVSDHGLNASTFSARVIASTASDLRSCLTGALGALKGPLHGGAPGPVLDMLDAIGDASQAQSWVQAELRAGRRIMGFGHRIYRVRDPRADMLKATVRQLQLSQDLPRLRQAEAIENVILQALQAHKPDRPLETNVEFYTALLLDALGFERQAFTAVFALGRALGWIGHVLEQQATGRLIRPQSVYIGRR